MLNDYDPRSPNIRTVHERYRGEVGDEVYTSELQEIYFNMVERRSWKELALGWVAIFEGVVGAVIIYVVGRGGFQ